MRVKSEINNTFSQIIHSRKQNQSIN